MENKKPAPKKKITKTTVNKKVNTADSKTVESAGVEAPGSVSAGPGAGLTTLKGKAQLFIEEYAPRYCEDNDAWYMYENGIYVEQKKSKMELLADYICEYANDGVEDVKRHDRIELLNKVKIRQDVSIDLDDFNKHQNKFILNNVAYNLDTGKPEPHSPSLLSTMNVNYSFIKDAECPRFMEFLKEVLPDDPGAQEFLIEFMGYCLTYDTRAQKFVVLLGAGRNGKTVFLNILKHLVGNKGVSKLSLHKLNEKHLIHKLKGMRLNIGGEIDNVLLKNAAMLKLIVSSGEEALGEPKYHDAEEFIPKCKLIFSANQPPRIVEDTDAIRGRMIVVKFNQKFDDKTADKNLMEKLIAELPGIFNLAVNGLKRYRTRGYFKTSTLMEQAAKTIHSQNNPVEEFIKLYYDVIPEAETYRGEVYANFKEYRARFGCRFMSANELWSEIHRLFPYVEAPDRLRRIDKERRDRPVFGLKPKK